MSTKFVVGGVAAICLLIGGSVLYLQHRLRTAPPYAPGQYRANFEQACVSAANSGKRNPGVFCSCMKSSMAKYLVSDMEYGYTTSLTRAIASAGGWGAAWLMRTRFESARDAFEKTVPLPRQKIIFDAFTREATSCARLADR